MRTFWRFAALLCCLTCAACGPDVSGANNSTPSSGEDGWSCVTERDDWERCDGDSMIWCHAENHGEYDGGHFHESVNCQDRYGQSCVELDERTAACLDESQACEEGWSACQERDALNCMDGAVATMRCSLTEVCELTGQGARCVSRE